MRTRIEQTPQSTAVENAIETIGFGPANLAVRLAAMNWRTEGVFVRQIAAEFIGCRATTSADPQNVKLSGMASEPSLRRLAVRARIAALPISACWMLITSTQSKKTAPLTGGRRMPADSRYGLAKPKIFSFFAQIAIGLRHMKRFGKRALIQPRLFDEPKQKPIQETLELVNGASPPRGSR